jgi:hypothetical protein
MLFREEKPRSLLYELYKSHKYIVGKMQEF